MCVVGQCVCSMAWTAREEEEKREYFDPPETLEKKVQQLAEWVRDSKHFIVFTVSGNSRMGEWVYVGSYDDFGE